MAGYELTMMVPVKVRVDGMATVGEAFDYAAQGLHDWSVAQSGGQSTGYAVTLIAAEEVEVGATRPRQE